MGAVLCYVSCTVVGDTRLLCSTNPSKAGGSDISDGLPCLPHIGNSAWQFPGPCLRPKGNTAILQPLIEFVQILEDRHDPPHPVPRILNILFHLPLLPTGCRIAKPGLKDIVVGHGFEPGVDVTLFATSRAPCTGKSRHTATGPLIPRLHQIGVLYAAPYGVCASGRAARQTTDPHTVQLAWPRGHLELRFCRALAQILF